MERKPSAGEFRKVFVPLLLLVGFLCPGRFCLAATPQPAAGDASRVEAVVIHVDEWAVYAPNLVFYFDTGMDKKKLDSLRRAANGLRNKKALIVYSTGVSNDKRNILVDIVSAGRQPHEEAPVQQAVEPSAPAQEEAPVEVSEDEEAPAEITSDETAPEPQSFEESDRGNKGDEPEPTTKEETSRGRKSGQPEPITKEEVRAFVSRVLYLNGRKDIQAIAPFYADKVNYYDRGVVGRDKVLQDLGYYFRNWAEIDTTLDGDVAMAGFEPEVRVVKFVSSFSVKNDKKAVAGKTENVWIIQRVNGTLRLIDVKQKILK